MGLSLAQIRERLGGRLVGKEAMKRSVIKAIQKLPDKFQEIAIKKVWFVSSFDDAWGFVLTGEELQGKHLIFLSDELFSEDSDQIDYTILHEIGHVVLNHRNAILESQTTTEVQKQEAEADAFARRNV